MSSVLVGYEHFVGIARRLAWREEDIDLADDAERWPRLDPARRERVTAFVAGFGLAEERVAVDLRPFVEAASSVAMADCFRAQAVDEQRHARFFDRYRSQVLQMRDLNECVAPELAQLFERRLAAAATALASGRLPLADAVALYHLLLEGVVFSAGQSTLLAELQASAELPGLREGLERIVADERWHIGFGVRILRGDPGRAATAIDPEHALDAWGTLIPRRWRDAVLAQHRRRLAAAGLAA